MNCSVVIPSLYELDGDYLKLCAQSLRASTEWPIIVVTNGSQVKPDLRHIPGISQHLHTRDQGQCNAVNIGAQMVSTKYMLVSNSDMYYAPDWNKHLKFGFECFSPNLIEPVNNAGSAPPFLKADGGLDLNEFDKELVDGLVKTLPEKGVNERGFNLPFFIKKDLWDFLGGYDVNYDPFGSNGDTDLQTRLNLAGVIPMRLRDVLVYHFSSKTPTFAPENDAFRQHNFEYFYSKFGFDRDELGSDVWYNADMIPEDKSKIKYSQAPYVT